MATPKDRFRSAVTPLPHEATVSTVSNVTFTALASIETQTDPVLKIGLTRCDTCFALVTDVKADRTGHQNWHKEVKH